MIELNKIDLVYVLGNGSNWNNNELRFSLRSVQQNLRNVRNIYVIGEKPSWLTGVIHIKEIDPYKIADANIIHKVLKACNQEGLTENFLFMNDDYIINRKVDATEIPAYHKGDLKDFDTDYYKNFWRKRLKNTRDVLDKKGYSTFHFDGHVPIIMNKDLFKEIISEFDYLTEPGLTMKSIYANVAYEHSARLQGEKQVIFRPYKPSQYKTYFTDCDFLSVNDNGLTIPYKKWIYTRFSEASKYELKPENELCIQVLNWFMTDQDVQKGIELYCKKPKSAHVVKYFKRMEKHLSSNKLERHLNKLI